MNQVQNIKITYDTVTHNNKANIGHNTTRASSHKTANKIHIKFLNTNDPSDQCFCISFEIVDIKSNKQTKKKPL